MKEYVKPDFKIQMFEVKDVITASVDENGLAKATVSGQKAAWDSRWEITDVQ